MSNSTPQRVSVTKLYELVRLAAHGQMRIDMFCEEFERAYNLQLDKNLLSGRELQAFGGLFDKVVWFSPYPEEREQFSRYLGEDEIHQAIEVAMKALG